MYIIYPYKSFTNLRENAEMKFFALNYPSVLNGNASCNRLSTMTAQSNSPYILRSEISFSVRNLTSFVASWPGKTAPAKRISHCLRCEIQLYLVFSCAVISKNLWHDIIMCTVYYRLSAYHYYDYYYYTPTKYFCWTRNRNILENVVRTFVIVAE